MNTLELPERVTLIPDMMVGKLTIRKYKISVIEIWIALSKGVTILDLLKTYPKLELKDIIAAQELLRKYS